MAALDRYIDEHLDESLADLTRLTAIPSVSSKGEHMDEAARYVAELLDGAGFTTQILPTGGFPVVYADSGEQGWAHAALLQPLRRAAGGAAGPVGVAALRRRGARRAHLRARHLRRQGTGHLADRGDARGAGRHRRLSGASEVRRRGRGGDRQPASGAVRRASRRPAQGRRLRLGVRRRGRRGATDDLPGPARPALRRVPRAHDVARRPLRQRAQPAQRGVAAAARARHDQGRERAHPHPWLL